MALARARLDEADFKARGNRLEGMVVLKRGGRAAGQGGGAARMKRRQAADASDSALQARLEYQRMSSYADPAPRKTGHSTAAFGIAPVSPPAARLDGRSRPGVDSGPDCKTLSQEVAWLGQIVRLGIGVASDGTARMAMRRGSQPTLQAMVARALTVAEAKISRCLHPPLS
jgi:hypothetical protein